MLPTITGGSGVDTGVTSVGVLNDTGEGRTGVRGPAEAYHNSLLKCWSKLVACSPDLAEAERCGGYGARDAAVNSYRAALSRRDEVASIRAARDDNIYYTLRGGKISEFYPKGVSLPTSESLPTPESVIDGTCKSGSPYARALAAIETIWNWFDLQKEWRALDDYTAANWQPGDTKIRLRESIRYVSTAQPYAGRWLDTKLDGSNATCIPDDIFIGELQRRNGLHLSQCRSTVTRALELGDTVGGAKDYHGDWFLNNAARRRPHDGVLRAWYDCVHAVSVSRPVMGDAEKPELTKQFNEGYKTDLAEPGAKTRSARSNFGPPSGVACPLGSAAPPPEATPAPLETSSPSATPKSAPALQTWAASNAGSVVNGRSTTPPAKATSSHSVATTMMGSSPNATSSTCFSTRHSAAASRRQQLQRSTALRARLNARALTAPRTLPTPASHLCHTTRNASPSLR